MKRVKFLVFISKFLQAIVHDIMCYDYAPLPMEKCIILHYRTVFLFITVEANEYAVSYFEISKFRPYAEN